MTTLTMLDNMAYKSHTRPVLFTLTIAGCETTAAVRFTRRRENGYSISGPRKPRRIGR
jgi:hypothetical protein